MNQGDVIRFLPPDFDVPELLETDRFRIRPLTIHDLVKDYDTVMTSREPLWDQFGQAWGWPSEDLTLEQDLIDLAWHQKEAQRRSSFAYAVMRPDERVQLGCIYIVPSHKQGVDAAAALWVRASELAGLDVHKCSVTACVRVPDGHSGRYAATRRLTTTAADLYVVAEWLASQLPGDPGGDGVDRVLLEAGLAPPRRPGGVLAAQRGPHAQRPWA